MAAGVGGRAARRPRDCRRVPALPVLWGKAEEDQVTAGPSSGMIKRLREMC